MRTQVIDRFNDQDLSEYSGDTGEFSFTTTDSEVYEGTAALVATGSTGHEITSSSGLDNYPSRGDTFRIRVWGVNGPERPIFRFFRTDSNNLYYILVDISGNDIILRKITTGTNTKLAEDTSVAYTHSGYQEIEVDTSDTANNTISVTVWDDSGTQIGSASTTDSDHDSGGIAILENASSTPAENRYDDFRIV